MRSSSLLRHVDAGYKERTWISIKVAIMLVERNYSGMSISFTVDSRMPDSVLKVHFVLNFKILFLLKKNVKLRGKRT